MYGNCLMCVYRSQVAICRECYNVFKKYLEGDSRKNENYLARFIEFFQTQVSLKKIGSVTIITAYNLDGRCARD